MAVVKFIPSKKMQTRAGVAFILSYCARDSKTIYNGKKYVSGFNCVASSAYSEFMNTKLQYEKTSGRMFYHLFQSFPKEENITPETAHKIAMELVKEFDGYEVLVSTHSDKEHIHSHFIVNSVSHENGMKMHCDKDIIQKLRDRSDEMCHEYGLSVIVPQKKKMKPMSEREYRSASKGQSWKIQLAVQIDEAMKYARSREDFTQIMQSEGYQVKWTDERKNITYTTPDGKKCCDDKLHEEKYLKGNMENEFRIREEILGGIEETGVGATENSLQGRAVRDGDRAELESDDRLTGGGDRNDETALREARHADDRGQSDILYGEATGYSDRIDSEVDSRCTTEREKNLADAGTVSAENEYSSNRIYRDNEDGSFESILTGWENERAVFTGFISAEGRDEAFYQAAISDFTDPVSLIGSGISLIAEAGNIIDNDHPVEDCTTMKRPNSRKKKKEQGYSGPVMGGM
jgi:hypothetical protein